MRDNQINNHMIFKVIDNRKEGQKRTITKYLYLPTRIGNEYRWLERASIEQSLHRCTDPTCGSEWWEWRNTKWLD